MRLATKCLLNKANTAALFVVVGLPHHHTAEAIGACFIQAWPAPYSPQHSAVFTPASSHRSWGLPTSRPTLHAPLHRNDDTLAAEGATSASCIVRQQSTDVRAGRLHQTLSIVYKSRAVVKALFRWMLMLVATLVIGIFSPHFCHAPSCFACLGIFATQESSMAYPMAPDTESESVLSSQIFMQDLAMRAGEHRQDFYSDEYDEDSGLGMTTAPASRLVRQLPIFDDRIAHVETAGAGALCSSASIDGLLDQVFERTTNRKPPPAARTAPMSEMFDHVHIRKGSCNPQDRRWDSTMEALLDAICERDRECRQEAYDTDVMGGCEGDQDRPFGGCQGPAGEPVSGHGHGPDGCGGGDEGKRGGSGGEYTGGEDWTQAGDLVRAA